MEKKKIKLWKKVLIVVIVIIIILIGIVTRNAMILADLDEKATGYENNNKNIYISTVFDSSNYKSKTERFIKDDVDKLVLEKTNLDGNKTKMIQITYPTERKMFTESNNIKVMNVYKETAATRGAHIENSTNASYSTIMNFAYSMNFQERILNSLVTKIKSVDMDGKKCYELSSLKNSNFLYDINTTKLLVYIEKETGLPIKVIEEIKENNEIKKNVTSYEYKFNVVTDKDIEEPDIKEYKLQE